MKILTIKRKDNYIFETVLLLFLVTSLIYSKTSLADKAPTIKLFPTTVLEEIKHTGKVASEMESSLQTSINQLDQQQQLFKDSKCEGNESDQGCEQLARQMGSTYLEMLDVMANKLPEMEVAVNNTSSTLEKRIRKELGHKKSSWDMQELLLGDYQNSSKNKALSMRGRSGMRLSDRFNQYYKLVARSGSNTNNSLAVVASDIYLDMKETQELIARTRDEISRATLMEQLNQSMGMITPEMQNVVNGVKAILFGEEESMPLMVNPLTQPDQEYKSPLQL